MKIFYVGQALDGSYLYRCYNNIISSKHDVSGDINIETAKKIQTRAIIESDIVIFYRPADEQRLQIMKMLKQKGVIVGYENDDTFNLQESHRLMRTEFADISKHKKDMAEQCLLEADFVTTTTEFLAEEYRKKRGNVFVLPNRVNFNLYPETKRKKTGDVIRILLSGSLLWCNDGFNFLDTVKELNKMPNVQIVMFGNTDDKMKIEGVENHNYVLSTEYPQKLKDLNIDLCLIPREDNYFNRCKSNCKYLEMSAMKIPVIAQGFPDKQSPYDLIAEEGAPITIATDDWLDKISKVDLSVNGYDWVKANYNNDSNIFDKIIKQII